MNLKKLFSVIIGLSIYLSVLPIILKWIWNIYLVSNPINYVQSLIIVVIFNVLLSIYLKKRKDRKSIINRLNIIEQKINLK